MKKPIIIIPARYASTRFPGKPLALINGKPMIQHVFERCCEVCNQVAVATDDERIAKTVVDFGGECVMTSSNHQSGTDRCAEAAAILSEKYAFDIVVNVQGDEPFISSKQINEIIGCYENPGTEIATLITPIHSSETLFNPNKVKVVRSASGKALYFSRSPIPYLRDFPHEEWLDHAEYYLHIGMYAFRKETLKTVTLLAPSSLEKSEKLEQLRWLENGFHITTEITLHENIGIDTPEDLEKVLRLKL
jgi:3-deoxy-manno-octulosonate cytidylyltransferase (CMP-KDO synthetase)